MQNAYRPTCRNMFHKFRHVRKHYAYFSLVRDHMSSLKSSKSKNPDAEYLVSVSKHKTFIL